MPISTISSIYISQGDDPQLNPFKQPDNVEQQQCQTTNNKCRSWYFGDIFLILLLFPTLLILAVLLDSIFHTEWSVNEIINYCIVGITIIIFGVIIFTLCYYAIELRSQFKGDKNTHALEPEITEYSSKSMASNNSIEFYRENGLNSTSLVSSPPNYYKIYPVDDGMMQPPSYDSLSTITNGKNGQRDFIFIPMYI